MRGCCNNRFIPICTGNSSFLIASAAFIAVHPHMHGELHFIQGFSDYYIGSSPYARGTRDFISSGSGLFRFIPICTGNSRIGAECVTMEAVHPHMHGELFFAMILSAIFYGSSPYARGTPNSSVVVYHWLRFIPICTGNSRLRKRLSILHSVHPHMHGELSSVIPTLKP